MSKSEQICETLRNIDIWIRGPANSETEIGDISMLADLHAPQAY